MLLLLDFTQCLGAFAIGIPHILGAEAIELPLSLVAIAIGLAFIQTLQLLAFHIICMLLHLDFTQFLGTLAIGLPHNPVQLLLNFHLV